MTNTQRESELPHVGVPSWLAQVNQSSALKKGPHASTPREDLSLESIISNARKEQMSHPSTDKYVEEAAKLEKSASHQEI